MAQKKATENRVNLPDILKVAGAYAIVFLEAANGYKIIRIRFFGL